MFPSIRLSHRVYLLDGGYLAHHTRSDMEYHPSYSSSILSFILHLNRTNHAVCIVFDILSDELLRHLIELQGFIPKHLLVGLLSYQGLC